MTTNNFRFLAAPLQERIAGHAGGSVQVVNKLSHRRVQTMFMLLAGLHKTHSYDGLLLKGP